MFCYKCGYEISDDAQFCSKCGTAQNTISSALTTNPQPESKDLDREAIIIYLSDVLAMECSINKLQNAWSNIDNSIKSFEATNYNEQIQCTSDHYVWFRYDGKEFYVYLSKTRDNYTINLSKNTGNYTGAWFPFEYNREYLEKGFPWSNYYRRSVKKSFFESYEQFKATAPYKYNENAKKIQPSINNRSEISDEIDKAKELLKKAYSINLIPQQFRNIYAVWFIYDYLSTSNENLSAAFLHCDLDKIKQKLDTIIEQQEEIIISQRILMAQNEQMIEQNQQTLNMLASIERNTDRAVQYSKIASNNAEVCAWISIANYIRN